jgi:hypothetical protein
VISKNSIIFQSTSIGDLNLCIHPPTTLALEPSAFNICTLLSSIFAKVAIKSTVQAIVLIFQPNFIALVKA